MAIDEKYLDDLLKSISENEEKPRTMDDAMREMASSPDGENEDWENNADDFFSKEQDGEHDNTLDLDDYLEKALPEAEAAPEEEADSEEMELLKEITAAGLSYERADLDAPRQDEEDLDITEMINGTGSGDDDLDEINGLLNKVDETAIVDEDILALLEKMENNGEGEETEDLFKTAESETPETVQVKEEKTDKEPVPKEKKEKKKKVRKEKAPKPEKGEKKFKIWGRKKADDKKQESEQEQLDEEVSPIVNEEIAVDPGEIVLEEIEPGIGAYEEAEEPENIKTEDAVPDKEKEKKPGFLSKLITALMQDDDFDDAAEENKKLLKEIGDEGKKDKKGKRKKGKGGADDQKTAKKADKKKPKKEKPKKQKAPKQPKEKKEGQAKEKAGKPLGKRTWFVLIAFSGTLLASIILLSVFLPEYADKKAARRAFYAGDYETAYTLLYDQKINADDVLIYNKAKTICTMERRIKSYENNMTLNRELEAVDALLKGVSCYQLLTEADEYGVRSQVDALYSQICSILENNYGISEEEALEINTYDSEAYTRKLHEVVYGTGPKEETDVPEPEAAEPEAPEEPVMPEDILPEEETMLN